MKKVAIIGSGLAGLGVGYYLHHFLPEVNITFFDEAGLGGKTSKMASGLLHPYPGKQARRSKDGHEAFRESVHLLEVARKYSPVEVADFSPIEKFTRDDDHYLDQHPDVEKLGERHYLIKTAATVYPPRYLQGLFSAIDRAQLIQRKVTLDELDSYEHVIIAAGAGSLQLGLELPQLKINKGQILSAEGTIERGILCGGYLVKSEQPGVIYIGSTYEHELTTEEPDWDIALSLIGRKVEPHFPSLRSLHFIDCKAGLRVTSPHHHFPLIKQLSPKYSIFTALGSRGLLYHAYYGKKLAKTLCFQDSQLV